MWLRQVPRLTLAFFLVPIAAGLVGTLLPAFGWFPAIGGESLSLRPWADLVSWPGFATSLRLTLTTGLLATILSVALAIGIVALGSGRRWFRTVERLSTPLLASPHVAVAIGLAFLLAPSGWLVRLVSPELTGWDRPPTGLVTVRDPWGLSMVAGLVVKEIPYLMLMITAACVQAGAPRLLAAGRALGYGRAATWVKVVLPTIYPQVRLPIYAVLAYSLSAVDIGIILAPGSPPPLAVLAARWFSDYDLARYYPAAAAATMQLLLVIVCILLWRMGERLAASLGRRWVEDGERAGPVASMMPMAGGLALVAIVAGIMSIASMAVWSLARTWRFPDALPDRWTIDGWMRGIDRVDEPALATIIIGMAATALALLLALGCLENEARSGRRPGRRSLWLLYVPLLIPQIAFLFGTQVVLVRLGLDGSWGAVIWAHLIFVLPYLFLSLADPWRALDPRFARTAAGLGAPPWRIFFAVKLPMLMRPILIACAVGFAVSVAQYLPTLFAGAGRIATLTTEAVTLSGGADRRIIGVYAFLQAMLPLIVYGCALAVPGVLWRRRRGLSG